MPRCAPDVRMQIAFAVAHIRRERVEKYRHGQSPLPEHPGSIVGQDKGHGSSFAGPSVPFSCSLDYVTEILIREKCMNLTRTCGRPVRSGPPIRAVRYPTCVDVLRVDLRRSRVGARQLQAVVRGSPERSRVFSASRKRHLNRKSGVSWSHRVTRKATPGVACATAGFDAQATGLPNVSDGGGIDR